MAIVIDSVLQCCDSIIKKSNGSFYMMKRMSGTSYDRRKPSCKRIRKLLEMQEGKCLYCEIPFGTHYKHPHLNKFRQTTVCCDHYVPFAYAQNNKDDNFVLACGICNGIKSSKMFETLEDAKAYVRNRRTEKGYIKEIYVM